MILIPFVSIRPGLNWVIIVRARRRVVIFRACDWRPPAAAGGVGAIVAVVRAFGLQLGPAGEAAGERRSRPGAAGVSGGADEH